MSAQTMFPLEIEEPTFCGLLLLHDRVERRATELQVLVAEHRAQTWRFDAFEDVVEMAEEVVNAGTWKTGWMRIRAERIFDLCGENEYWSSQREAGRQMAKLIRELACVVDDLKAAESFELYRLSLYA